jgi:hypothetical protein
MSSKVTMSDQDAWTDDDILYLEMRGRLPAEFRKNLGAKGRKALAAAVDAGEVVEPIRPSEKKSRGKKPSEAEKASSEPDKSSTNNDIRSYIVELSEELGVEPNLDGNKKALLKTVDKLHELRDSGGASEEEDEDDDGS